MKSEIKISKEILFDKQILYRKREITLDVSYKKESLNLIVTTISSGQETSMSITNGCSESMTISSISQWSSVCDLGHWSCDGVTIAVSITSINDWCSVCDLGHWSCNGVTIAVSVTSINDWCSVCYWRHHFGHCWGGISVIGDWRCNCDLCDWTWDDSL